MTEEEPTTESLLEKIRSRGYWEVIIRPTRFERERIKALSECTQIVQECRVRLRGWDYPHVSTRSPPHVGGVDYVESLTDWNGYKELWRMYQSGQFVHLFGCREDWLSERISIFGFPQHAYIEPGSVLSVLSTLYSVTEIYEFASRLAQKNLFDETIFLSIALHGMKNRKLIFFESQRLLFDDYVCKIADLPLDKTITVDELLGRGHELALDHTIWIFERFNWISPPRDILKEDQKKFLEHRI